ncbi:MAG: hypothetical protein MI754_01300 [Chromatiales bacterium]|nr:hypothetical protein [Chromatiales bacterium]
MINIRDEDLGAQVMEWTDGQDVSSRDGYRTDMLATAQTGPKEAPVIFNPLWKDVPPIW